MVAGAGNEVHALQSPGRLSLVHGAATGIACGHRLGKARTGSVAAPVGKKPGRAGWEAATAPACRSAPDTGWTFRGGASTAERRVGNECGGTWQSGGWT